MKKQLLVMLAVLPIPSMATAGPQFLGFSNDAVPADSRINGMHKACQATFGRKSRMCTDKEIFKSFNVPDISDLGPAWVHPHSNGGTGLYVRGPGVEDLTCAQWKLTSGGGARGLNIEDYNFNQGACTQILPVACCGKLRGF